MGVVVPMGMEDREWERGEKRGGRVGLMLMWVFFLDFLLSARRGEVRSWEVGVCRGFVE